MSDSDGGDSRATSQLLGARVASLLAVGFILGFAALAAFTWREHGQEEKLESFTHVSAVGDDSFFNVHTPSSDRVSIVHGGRTWQPRNLEKRPLRDTQMQSVGKDSATGLEIYQPLKNPAPDEIFLRIAPNGYVLLQPAR